MEPVSNSDRNLKKEKTLQQKKGTRTSLWTGKRNVVQHFKYGEGTGQTRRKSERSAASNGGREGGGRIAKSARSKKTGRPAGSGAKL